RARASGPHSSRLLLPPRAVVAFAVLVSELAWSEFSALRLQRMEPPKLKRPPLRLATGNFVCAFLNSSDPPAFSIVNKSQKITTETQRHGENEVKVPKNQENRRSQRNCHSERA